MQSMLATAVLRVSAASSGAGLFAGGASRHPSLGNALCRRQSRLSLQTAVAHAHVGHCLGVHPGLTDSPGLTQSLPPVSTTTTYPVGGSGRSGPSALFQRTSLNCAPPWQASASASSQLSNGPHWKGSASSPHHHPSSTLARRLKNSATPCRTSMTNRLGSLVMRARNACARAHSSAPRKSLPSRV